MLALLAGFGCTSDLAVVTVALPLVPDDVASIAVWVTDPAREVVVASATVSPPITEVELGVPAERPLLFSVLARTDRPGPPRLGGRMPGWVGRQIKRIPLGREQAILQITARPAGALTLFPDLDPRIEDPVTLQLEGEGGPIELSIHPDQTAPRVFALRTGRYHLSLSEEDRTRYALEGGDGFHVARRVESVGRFGLVPAPPELPPDAVRSLEIVLEDEGGSRIEGLIRTATDARALAVRVAGLDLDGLSTTLDEARAEIEITVETVPEGLAAPQRRSVRGLPATLVPLEVGGTGRMRVRAVATIDAGEEEERRLSANLRASLVPASVEPGRARRLELAVQDVSRLVTGTNLRVELIDARGFYAVDHGTLDFSRSDPWVFFPDGPEVQVGADAGGHVDWPVLRPSGPRGLSVSVAAVFTSTAPPGTLTASVTLPVLEMNE